MHNCQEGGVVVMMMQGEDGKELLEKQAEEATVQNMCYSDYRTGEDVDTGISESKGKNESYNWK